METHKDHPLFRDPDAADATSDLLDMEEAESRVLNAIEASPGRKKAGKRDDKLIRLRRRPSQRVVHGRHISLAQDILEELHEENPDDIAEEEGATVTPSLQQPTTELMLAVGLTPFETRPTDSAVETTGSDENHSDSHDTLDSESELTDLLSSKQAPTATGPFQRGPTFAKKSRSKRQKGKKWAKETKRLCKCLKSFVWTVIRSILCSYVVLLALPLASLAVLFYYHLGNPSFSFLPTSIKISWWLNFASRQIVTLELARLMQWILVDGIILGLKNKVKISNPFTTLAALQAKGWPLQVSLWVVLDFLMLHGDKEFQLHWLYFTGWGIYLQGGHPAQFLNSPGYLRLLLSMLLAAIATIFKRTYVTIYLGKRQFNQFRPWLEKILADAIIMSEIGFLSQQVSRRGKAEEMEAYRESSSLLADMDWTTLKFDGKGSGSAVSVESLEKSPRPSPKSDTDNREKFSRNVLSESQKIPVQLDSWAEPVNKKDKTEATIREVLKLRWALKYFDDAHPFGEAFGKANNREDFVRAAYEVFLKLLQLDPGASTLSFDVLASNLLVTKSGQKKDASKLMTLRKLFQPNAFNELPASAFIQSCDSVYKRVRYFRASVSNAAAIDDVLEGMINGAYWFVLSLVLLNIMHFNPYPLLVSITSLLVSLSFALGPSVSKYVEGALLVAVRRPYDLGDRIIITNAEFVGTPGPPVSWFVEDLSLFTTKLRHAMSNEVCNLYNHAIATSRIVNCNRSPNAIVYFDQKLHISILQPEKYEGFRESVLQYVADNPRTWHSLRACFVFSVEQLTESVTIRMLFRHRSSWQDAGKIVGDRSKLIVAVNEISMKYRVECTRLSQFSIMYFGGSLHPDHLKEQASRDFTLPKHLLSQRGSATATMGTSDLDTMFAAGSVTTDSNKQL